MAGNPFDRLAGAIHNAASKRGGHEEFLRRPQLSIGDLHKGDILIVKLYEDYKYWSDLDKIAPYRGEMGGDGVSISAAQALFSHVKYGSATSEHVVLIAQDGTERNYESIGCGVIESPELYDRWHAVYRPLSGYQTIINHATSIARSLARQHDLNDNDRLMAATPLPTDRTRASVEYRSGFGMAASAFRRKSAGHMTDIRLQRIEDIVYGGRNDLRVGMRMICSEFVAACYETAAYHLGQPRLLNIDPKAMTAKALESTLKKRNSYIQCVGIYQGSKRMIKRCPTCSGQVRCMYLSTSTGDRLTIQHDGKTRYPYVTICPQCNTCPTCRIVWSSTIDPDDPSEIVFFCWQCEGYPSDTSRYLDKDGIKRINQGGHAVLEGVTKKPKGDDDKFFIR